MGEKGAVLGEIDKKISIIKSFKIGKTVDTSGAGDCFNGALAYSLSNNQNTIESVKFACKSAGFSVTKEGTSMSMPKLNEILHIKT